MAEETITFELIRSIQREEQRGPKLTKLPNDFYRNVENYLQQKRNAENRKVVLETKNVERLIEDIFNRRERKILNQAIIAARTSIPPENLTEEEKEFFDVLVKSIKERRKEVLNHILAEKKEELVTMIVFNEDTPAFMGADEKTYGPFKKGDIAKLPEENIRVLIEQGMAKEFTVSK
jgi:DNA replication factor GINS